MLALSDTAAVDPKASQERDLIAVIGELVRELHPQRARFVDIAATSRLDRDLGIDSLGRTELILRIERAFQVRLPIDIVAEADTVHDLAAALARSAPSARLSRAGEPPPPALPLVPAASDARTLVEVLDWHVARHGDRPQLTLLQDEATVLGAMTYGELANAGRAVAAGLIARDIVPGDRVALMLPTSLDFFAAFFGILYAGAVPVPIYPPMRLAQLEDHLRRQAAILRNAGAKILVTTPRAQGVASLLRGQVESLPALDSVAALRSGPADVRLPPNTDPAAIALIQYTSGSTGDPKGVVLTHANLLANIRAMGQAMQASSADTFVSWLPLYHDMGLIGAWLGCLHFAARLYVMSPMSFLVRPESWLWAMHRFRATFSASPNFGFELCLNKVEDARLEGLDLSALRMVANGAEPVSPHTIRRFMARFGRYGFRPQALAPVYGLAENSVGLAFPPAGRAPIIDRVDREALTLRGVAEPARPQDPRPLEIVACGQPLSGHEIRIIDATGFELGERRQGRIEFRGPSATKGYFRNEPKTRELFDDGWLDTADRGYLAGGDIFITGRIKDIIIRSGRHIYPQEIEEAVAEIPGIRKGGVAVFGAADPASGTERLVVLAETRESDPAVRAKLQSRAHELVTELSGAAPDEIVLAPPRSVPKTSSGKIRRSAAKELYERGRIGAPQRALWRQILRMWLAGLGPRIRHLAGLVAEFLYAAWWWTVVGLCCLVGWPAIVALPKLEWRWAALRTIARVALAALRVPLTVRGLGRVPRGDAMLVFNHSSYVDALVLVSILPGEPVFVAKKEFARQTFPGLALRALGTLFVERYDMAASRADTEAVVAACGQGRILVFFPEGTFTRRPGLLGFYLGAFKVAAEAKVPVLPGALRGTRSMLRCDQWFPRWAPISVEIAEPILPSGTDFVSVSRLRDQVRDAVLARCGEPDLGELVKFELDKEA
ncbi:MAG: AMP-binding protein [Hyphomicrobiales bacterium]